MHIDSGPDRVVARKSAEFENFAVTLHKRPVRLLRRPAGAMAALVLAMYVFAGALHAFHDFDVANPSGKLIVSISQDGSQSEKGIASEQHCHGCFSVSMPAPLTAEGDLTPAQDIAIRRDVQRRGLPAGLDPPPPKSLT